MYIYDLHWYIFLEGIHSCWSVVGSWHSIEKVGWSIWMQGFALVTWIRIQPHKSVASESPDLFTFTSSDESGNENIPEWKYKSNRSILVFFVQF